MCRIQAIWLVWLFICLLLGTTDTTTQDKMISSPLLNQDNKVLLIHRLSLSMALCNIVAFMRGAWERLVPVPLRFQNQIKKGC